MYRVFVRRHGFGRDSYQFEGEIAEDVLTRAIEHLTGRFTYAFRVELWRDGDFEPLVKFDWGCVRCGSYENLHTVNGMRYCENCLEATGYERCTTCGAWTDYEFDDVPLCTTCMDRETATCHSCGQRHWPHELVGIDLFNGAHVQVCPNCIDSFMTCEVCGGRVHLYDSHEDWRGRVTCPNCYDPAIRNYSYRIPLHFHGEDVTGLYLGIELEFEVPDNMDKRELAVGLKEKIDPQGSHFILKEDGSLNYGVEVVTQPCSLEYHQNSYPWHMITEWLMGKGCKSHDANTCGLHVHVSREPMCNPDEIKIGYFVNSQRELFENLSRRTNNDYAKFKDKALDEEARYSEDRYEAVNFLNTDTVEFRLYRGTLRRESLLATIELTHATCLFCMETPARELLSPSQAREKFLTWISEHAEKYPYLIEYLPYRGIEICA